MSLINAKFGLVITTAMLLLGLAGGANAQGNLFLDGSVIGGSDTEFSDLVGITDTSLTLRVEAHKGQWGWFGDISYAELSDQEQGLVNYQFGSQRQHKLSFGYRYRELEYDRSKGIEVQKTIRGPVLGIVLGF